MEPFVTLCIVALCYVLAQCLSAILFYFFEDQLMTFFDATVGRFLD